MQVKLGVGALIEDLEGSHILNELIPALGKLSSHNDHRIRADATHYLSCIHSTDTLPYLRARLDDSHEEVREIAADALE